MTIFLDLDGTLIDSRQRLYQLFQYLIPRSNLSFDEYWDLKRNNISHKLIIDRYFPYINYKVFIESWMSLIETKEYLDLDFPFENVSNYLAKLRVDGNDVYLVTARQFIDGVYYQINKFGWLSCFNDILVTQQKSEKESIIRPLLKNNEKAYFIGDTGKDIQTAKALGVFSVGVYSGFLSKDILLTYQPDLLLSSITEFTVPNL